MVFDESKNNSYWPKMLIKKDIKFIINTYFKNKFIKQCN